MIEWLTDTLIMTGLLMGLVLMARRPVGRWFGAGAAYALWSLPMIRLVLPPLALPRGLLPQYHVGLERVAAVAASAPVEAVHTPLATAIPAAALPAAAAAPEFNMLSQTPWTELLLGIWLAGAVLFLVWRVLGYRAMRLELLRDAKLIGHAGNVRIIESPAAGAPLAFGVTDKVIALPKGFLATTDSETSDFAIAHELEHHAGSDLLALMAMQPLFALHWFNPLAWAAWKALRSDQETACDARVMAGCGRDDKAAYGRLIASFSGGGRLALIAPMAGPLSGEKPIIHRLRALTRKDVTPAQRALGRSLFALAVVAVPVTATVSYAAIEDAPVQETGPRPQAPGRLPSFHALAPGHEHVSSLPPSAPSSASQTPRWERAEASPVVPPVAPAPPMSPMPAVAEQPRNTVSWDDAAERAERMAAESLARAPRVEETVTADGQKVVRIIRLDGAGRTTVTSEMVIDDRCPADSTRGNTNSGHHGGTSVICTGTPTAAAFAAVNALRAARKSIEGNRHLDAQTRAEILADMDDEITQALQERDE